MKRGVDGEEEGTLVAAGAAGHLLRFLLLIW